MIIDGKLGVSVDKDLPTARLSCCRQAMRRAEANLRLDDVENGEFAEAGNDLYSEENVMTHPHWL